MRETTRVRGIVTACAVAVALVTPIALESAAYAAPDEREQCAAAAEQAQQLRDEGKYRRAREQMLVCARDVCPGPIKSDCGKWLTELDRDAPTVVFGARDAKGADVFDVRVSMDGAVIQERLDGKPILVDSGEHTFRFEAQDGTVREERVLLRAAEKARPIIVTLGEGGDSGGSTNGGTSGSMGDGEPRSGGKSILPLAVVGGIAAVGLASFGITGSSQVSDLKQCKPFCKEEDVDSARTKLIIADISLGVAIGAGIVGGIMLLTRSSGDSSSSSATTPSLLKRVHLDAGPTRGGGFATVGARF
jgi:hypothetical protein